MTAVVVDPALCEASRRHDPSINLIAIGPAAAEQFVRVRTLPAAAAVTRDLRESIGELGRVSPLRGRRAIRRVHRRRLGPSPT